MLIGNTNSAVNSEQFIQDVPTMKNNWKEKLRQMYFEESAMHAEYEAFVENLLAEQKKELMDEYVTLYYPKAIRNKVLEEVLKLVQEDIDFGAKHQQIVSTKAQSYILTQLKHHE